MNFHRNGLRELVQAGRRERNQPLTFGEVVDRLRLYYRDDSRVMLTNGRHISRVSRTSAGIHFDTSDATPAMTAGSLKRMLTQWVVPGTELMTMTVGHEDVPLVDVADINGIFYLIVKERRG